MTEQSATTGSRLFTGQSPGVPPDWVGFVSDYAVDGALKLESKSCAAVLFLEVTPDSAPRTVRTFAVAFGNAHLALNPEAFERNFGLKVTLNSVARRDLRNLDVATLESTSFQKRIQASRKADLGGFGIDIEKDLLRLAGGAPADGTFATALAGRDALTLTSKIAPKDLPEKCKKALQLFFASDYKKDFAFIDLIAPVRDKSLGAELDDLVFSEIEHLIAGKPSDLHLTLPEIIDPERGREVGYFGVGFKPGAKTGYSELAIEDYITELNAGRPSDVKDMVELKASHELRVVVDGKGHSEAKRRIYDCFVYETSHKGNTYVLFDGDWYKIDAHFFAEVDRDYNSLLTKSPTLKTSTSAKNERELIAELETDAGLLNLDQVKASPAGASGANLEPCDFLSRKREFIHLKDGHGSAPISHLWSQGVVAAESFIRDEKFRKAMRDAAIKRQKKAKKSGFEKLLPDGRTRPAAGDYTIVYGIMRHPYQKSRKLGLPFFSKVSLRAAARRLQLMGYAVELQLVEKK
ncbi:MAG: TIGR04141 family sporadically distributed protein [Bauldia sp.]|nr:TIGR04141 family sporadically distributed protein [Bauldia sp.]